MHRTEDLHIGYITPSDKQKIKQTRLVQARLPPDSFELILYLEHSIGYLKIRCYTTLNQSINQIRLIARFPLPKAELFKRSISKSAFPFGAIEWICTNHV